ncbi:MAG: hypothetical protein PHQ33_08380 [Bacteroidales bacterium]|nr:hypothetical protein [Bacteroidales bacterium]
MLLGGGLLVTVITIRSIRKKAQAEADQARLMAKKTAIDNETAAMENFQKYIVDPLKAEVEALRKAVASYKREMSRFRKAIEQIGECEYKDNCPVKNELKKDNDDEKVD